MITTHYRFCNQTKFFQGKVRDVYYIGEDLLVVIVTDRISAFDVILPQGIPYKGQVLNQIATKFLDSTEDIVPNWKLAVPDPVVTVGVSCEPFPIEMVIRGYLTGSAWREYQNGKRIICGVNLPEMMRENEKFQTPIITPTLKLIKGHDENISKEELIKQMVISKEDYEQLEYYTQALFQRGTQIANSQGLILVDTKYEFGKKNNKIYLIDEVHTPDSSRYFYKEGYLERFREGKKQKQLSKEFVRQWLLEQGFQGENGQTIPQMSFEYIEIISKRYIELYEKIMGEKFIKADCYDISTRVEKNIKMYLNNYK